MKPRARKADVDQDEIDIPIDGPPGGVVNIYDPYSRIVEADYPQFFPYDRDDIGTIEFPKDRPGYICTFWWHKSEQNKSRVKVMRWPQDIAREETNYPNLPLWGKAHTDKQPHERLLKHTDGSFEWEWYQDESVRIKRYNAQYQHKTNVYKDIDVLRKIRTYRNRHTKYTLRRPKDFTRIIYNSNGNIRLSFLEDIFSGNSYKHQGITYTEHHKYTVEQFRTDGSYSIEEALNGFSKRRLFNRNGKHTFSYHYSYQPPSMNCHETHIPFKVFRGSQYDRIKRDLLYEETFTNKGRLWRIRVNVSPRGEKTVWKVIYNQPVPKGTKTGPQKRILIPGRLRTKK